MLSTPMATRTFKQLGQAYGFIPAVITATIDNEVVFSGVITTIDIPLPMLPDPAVSGIELFTWTNTVCFSGTQSYSISVTGSPLLLTRSLADNVVANDTAAFGGFYFFENNGVKIMDPLTDVTIDGISMHIGHERHELCGQLYWIIPAGSTLTATLNVHAGC